MKKSQLKKYSATHVTPVDFGNEPCYVKQNLNTNVWLHLFNKSPTFRYEGLHMYF